MLHTHDIMLRCLLCYQKRMCLVLYTVLISDWHRRFWNPIKHYWKKLPISSSFALLKLTSLYCISCLPAKQLFFRAWTFLCHIFIFKSHSTEILRANKTEQAKAAFVISRDEEEAGKIACAACKNFGHFFTLKLIVGYGNFFFFVSNQKIYCRQPESR